MARKSFVVQKYESDAASASSGSASVYGSYLQYPYGPEAAYVGLAVREDEDTQLKSDDLAPPNILNEPSVPGALTPTIAYFQSQISEYGEVDLSWGVALAESLGATAQPTRVLIVYSELGEPQTISDGILLIDTATASTFTHYVQQGKWAYYSMFLKYENSSGSTYYDRVATLSELAPYNYGCTDDMYAKIPEYYRMLDADLDTGSGGPLKRMLSVFGFEADRTRTLIDYVMAFKDPLIANSEVLDVLAKDLSINIRSDELGAAKLRNILDGVGDIRRSVGTPGNIIAIIQAATGSEANIYPDALEGPRIDIYAQRVNLLKDPNISGGAAGSLIGGTPKSQTFTSTFEAGGASVPVVDATYEGGDPYSSLSPYDPFANPDTSFQQEIAEQYWQYAPDPASGGSTSYLKTIDNYIPIFSGDKLYFSMHGDFVENAQDSVIRVALYAPVSGTAASAGYSGTVDDNLIAESTNPVVIAGINYWELEIPDLGEGVAVGDTSLTLFINNEADLARGFQKLLLEKMQGGAYFDGDSTDGGWVINYATGQRVSDYRWLDVDDPSSDAGGVPQETYSVYNSNYKKTRALAERYLPLILPVTQISSADTVYSNDPVNIGTPIWSLKWNDVKGLEDIIVTTLPVGPLEPFP